MAVADNGSTTAPALLLLCGQLCFLVMMMCCLAIEPSALALKRGLSYCGTHVGTVVPYSLGFALCVSLTAAAVARIRGGSKSLRRLRVALGAIAALLAAIPLTPYSLDLVFDWLHIGLTTALFALALVVGWWVAVRLRADPAVRGLVAAETAGGVLVLVAQVGLLDFMIPVEVCFQIAFALLVVRALPLLQRRRDAPEQTAC